MLNDFAARHELLGYARLRFFEPGTTDKVSVFADAACTVAHVCPVLCDEHGNVPEIFFSDGRPVSVSINDSADIAIAIFDPWGPAKNAHLVS